MYCPKCNWVPDRTECTYSRKYPHKCLHCDERLKFSCLKCDRVYLDVSSIHKHDKIAHAGTARTFSCSDCSYSTHYRHHLDRHMQQHNQCDHMYYDHCRECKVCPSCGRKYKDLAFHLIKKTCANKKQNVTSNPSDK